MLSLAKRVVTVFGLGQSGGKQPKQKDNLFAPNIDDKDTLNFKYQNKSNSNKD